MTTNGKREAVDGRATRWDGHKARRRAEVIDAAIAAIEEHGVEVSVRQVADRLQLPRPVVYRHFEGRADLDEQIRRRILRSLLTQLMPTLDPNGTVHDAVAKAVGAYVGWVADHPNLHRFLSDSAPQPDSALTSARNRIGGRLADLFTVGLTRFGIDPAPARPMAFGIVALADGVVNSWRADSSSTLTSEQVEAMLTESVLALFEGNARSLGVPLARDTIVSELLTRTETAALVDR
ncbi:TetR/AcrR family transcriptional regulator [Nocardia sp. XZ_19_385]|uniref:TetR/AcrR family transcriptional regulator n=1 Tax=Nocardia sp. XZ_19_385 TaxID=2769488 RepID=UPI00188F1A40|nr:TetR/AcrR family transcriptional regulator [Nocardia sp. XZ_19_385]